MTKALAVLYLVSTFARAAPPVSSPAAVGWIEFPAETPPAAQSVNVRGPSGMRTIQAHGAVFAGEHIVTGPSQTVVIKLQDQSELTLAPASDLAVTQFVNQPNAHSAEIALDQGLVHAAVIKKTYTPAQPFMIRTKTAVMGVRGTEFLAEQEPGGGATTLHTLEGSVAIGQTPKDLLGANTSALVQAGHKSGIEKGESKPSEPKRFNPKTLFTTLGARSPGMVKQIERHRALRQAKHRQTKQNRSKAHPGKDHGNGKLQKTEAWKPRRQRRAIGHQ